MSMRGVTGALAILFALAFATGVSYAHPLGHTTENHTTQAGPPIFPGSSFETLVEGPGAARVVRGLPTASALAGREGRRRSLVYMAQLTDFQLADEESPARVEFVDRGPNSAFRPQEAFHPWVIDYSFRQMNQFTPASPHVQGGGARAPMDLGLLTGDQSDNQQFNETLWVRQLIEGGEPLTPNSGIKSDYSECRPENRAELLARETAGAIPDEPTYMGVQDYDDLGFQAPDYYDPDEPFGDQYGTFPTWQGLMDRAQSLTFVPVGLRRGDTPVPTYVSNGNHDGLVQGNEDAVKAFEDIATGCFKVAGSTSTLPIGPSPDPNQLFSPAIGFAVRPDEPGRRFVDRVELKRIYSSGIQQDDHGFAFIDPAELAASGFSATYWAHDLKPGIRFVSIDTVSDGGVVQESSEGNIDNPQWQWLHGELDRAEADGKLVILFGHHPIRSLISHVPDEAAQRCGGSYDSSGTYSSPDEHGHDANPGCDLDPRASTPVHDGDELRALLNEHSNVLTYVAGHTHENKVLACGSEDGCPDGGNWWELNTAATADWPQQSRLIEIMDNHDGTLSIFGTLTDPGGPLAVPDSGTPATGFGNDELASISHAVAANDPQLGDGTAEGAAQDQNVELLVDDPRTATLRGTSGDDVIRGTPGSDVIVCGPGDDTVFAGAGDDVIRCGPGNDRIHAGRGNDRVSGGSGNDRIFGGPGRDRLFGRSGADRILGQPGNDVLAGNSGADRMLGGGGRNRMSGGRSGDDLDGGPRADRMRGGAGNDRMRGRSGPDRMNGGSGRDRLAGQAGNDRLFGGRGRDRLFGGPGRDTRRQ
jgi:RTX calcium-binding nonapeptide repeat (4 copies)/Calcineurin-like phosphoesterase